MLKAVENVRDAILAEQPSGCATLQAITRIVSGVTLIDHVWFVEYDVPRENPIWGSFRRFERRLAVYEPLQTIVEVRYAKHLTESERKFIVCKELCHALDVENGAHHVSNGALQTLVETFSLRSQNLSGTPSTPWYAELMAEVCSVEIICPLPIRRERLAAGSIDIAAISAEFGLLPEYAAMAFQPNYLNWIEARFAEI